MWKYPGCPDSCDLCNAIPTCGWNGNSGKCEAVNLPGHVTTPCFDFCIGAADCQECSDIGGKNRSCSWSFLHDRCENSPRPCTTLTSIPLSFPPSLNLVLMFQVSISAVMRNCSLICVRTTSRRKSSTLKTATPRASTNRVPVWVVSLKRTRLPPTSGPLPTAARLSESVAPVTLVPRAGYALSNAWRERTVRRPRQSIRKRRR